MRWLRVVWVDGEEDWGDGEHGWAGFTDRSANPAHPCSDPADIAHHAEKDMIMTIEIAFMEGV